MKNSQPISPRKKRKSSPLPTLDFEREFEKKGYLSIAGVDEVGRGCLAGPVVAGAVILDFDNFPEGINDSKKLTARVRKDLSDKLKLSAVSYAYGFCTPEEIDKINILQASKLAMVRALENLHQKPDCVLIDGREKLNISIAQKSVIHGDQLSVSIAAASILAKVYRDEWMGEFDLKYPGYEFAKHKGYGSVAHRKSLQEKGRSPIHRKSFSWTPV